MRRGGDVEGGIIIVVVVEVGGAISAKSRYLTGRRRWTRRGSWVGERGGEKSVRGGRVGVGGEGEGGAI